MKIADLLAPESIRLGVSAVSKQDAVDQLVALQKAAGNLKDPAAYKSAILARENQGTTAIGQGIAVPHAKSDSVRRPGLAAITLQKGVDYGAPDGKPSRLFFMIAAPLDGDLHLEILSRLMVLLMDGEFAARLLAAGSRQEFLQLINQAEAAKYPEHPQADPAPVPREGYRILAVTACPTGIAHTYMAAESLEKAGAAMGMPLKAETNGSGGAKNILTREEIAACDGIIIAADKNVDLARFDGKPVLKAKVADGIHKPQELIQKIQNGQVPVYHHHGDTRRMDSGDRESAGHQIYKHLMNGVSHMLPFVIGGGIMIALAFLIDAGHAGSADFGMVNPVAAFFKTVGSAAFNFMLPILAGFIARSIADRPGLVVGFVGGYLANAGLTFGNITGEGAVSAGFIGALIAGFAGGYLMLGLEKLCDHLPDMLEGIKSILIYPLLGTMVIGAVMCLINPYIGWLNTGITNLLHSMSTHAGTSVLLGALLGGMMSVDMGGPINKAAYVFGTATLTAQVVAAGGSEIMAAVMIGGMVPPIAIALSTTFFKRKWTPDDRKSTLANYIMGCCFISEAAIPFAAADPLRVIPSCVVGSAVAGALSMIFGCQLSAPHGGLFVFALVSRVGFYILSLLIGSVVGCLMLTALKKTRTADEAGLAD